MADKLLDVNLIVATTKNGNYINIAELSANSVLHKNHFEYITNGSPVLFQKSVLPDMKELPFRNMNAIVLDSKSPDSGVSEHMRDPVSYWMFGNTAPYNVPLHNALDFLDTGLIKFDKVFIVGDPAFCYHALIMTQPYMRLQNKDRKPLVDGIYLATVLDENYNGPAFPDEAKSIFAKQFYKAGEKWFHLYDSNKGYPVYIQAKNNEYDENGKKTTGDYMEVNGKILDGDLTINPQDKRFDLADFFLFRRKQDQK